jgi:hypothetical protein
MEPRERRKGLGALDLGDAEAELEFMRARSSLELADAAIVCTIAPDLVRDPAAVRPSLRRPRGARDDRPSRSFHDANTISTNAFETSMKERRSGEPIDPSTEKKRGLLLIE